MEDLLDQARGIADNWERDYKKLQRREKLGPVIHFGGLAVGVVGGGFMFSGLTSGPDQSFDVQRFSTGAAMIAVDVLVYSLGRWVFKWW